MFKDIKTYCYNLPDSFIQNVDFIAFYKFLDLNDLSIKSVTEKIFTIYLTSEMEFPLITRIRSEYPISSIIIVSSITIPKIIANAVKAGADYYCLENDLISYKEYINDSIIEKSDDENISLWKQVLDKLPYFIFIKDAKDKKYLYINPVAEAITEYDDEAVKHRSFEEFSELAAMKVRESDDIVIKLKRAYNLNNINLEKMNGKKITINLTKFPLFDKNGDVRYILGLAKEAKKEDSEVNFMKNKFISIVSHEFRTPLTTIMLSSDLLRRYGDNWLADEKEKHYDRIKNTVLSMTKMIENILNITRLEEGNYKLHKEQIDLPSFCKAHAENIEFSTNFASRINFNFNGDSNNIFLDETLIGLIVTNLLSNAVKYNRNYMPIDFMVLRGDHTLIFEIEDRGIGIPTDDQDKLFDLFHRAKNVGHIGGYGLGLALVKQCVDLHSGSIKFHSEENLGTKFMVTIPL